jgi:Lon protease-like protein
MFPLGSPIVPHAGIPLHVFEDRYRALIHDVTAGDGRFGIVMIDRGSEVGGGDARRDVGVLVEVGSAEELEDGRWVLVAVGIGRIRVTEWLDDDPYPRAVVEDIDERSVELTAGIRDDIQTQVRRLAGMLAELGEPAPPVTVELADDPVVAAWQAVAVSPIGAFDTQCLLEIDDPEQRVAAIVRGLTAAEELVEFRLRA